MAGGDVRERRYRGGKGRERGEGKMGTEYWGKGRRRGKKRVERGKGVKERWWKGCSEVGDKWKGGKGENEMDGEEGGGDKDVGKRGEKGGCGRWREIREKENRWAGGERR